MANKTTGNYNFGESYIMNADKVSVDNDEGASTLYREGLEFDTRAQTGVLTEDMPKKQTKTTIDPSFDTMAEDRNYFS
tara:strand:+ start:362 stop:595 length:234 start_codon:yes stop_codon:yes gene_type:complete